MENIFTDPDGDILLYTVSLEDDDAPLPSWITFWANESNLTFTGTAPPEISQYRVKVTADDQIYNTSGVFKIIIPDTAPQLMYGIDQQFLALHQPFIFELSEDQVMEWNGEELTYKAYLSNG